MEHPDVGAGVYAMPLRHIAYRGAVVDCARDPLTCARAVAAAMLANAREQYHVLGPAKRALLHLIRLGMCRYIRSFDNLSYRRAATTRLKQMMEGSGKPQARHCRSS